MNRASDVAKALAREVDYAARRMLEKKADGYYITCEVVRVALTTAHSELIRVTLVPRVPSTVRARKFAFEYVIGWGPFAKERKRCLARLGFWLSKTGPMLLTAAELNRRAAAHAAGAEQRAAARARRLANDCAALEQAVGDLLGPGPGANVGRDPASKRPARRKARPGKEN